MDELNTNHKLHKCMKYQLCSDSINKIIDSWGFAVCILYFLQILCTKQFWRAYSKQAFTQISKCVNYICLFWIQYHEKYGWKVFPLFPEGVSKQ